MIFIFPQNYNFKNKLFGVLDYNTIFINVILALLILFFINIFLTNITLKIIIFIILYFPFLLFSFSGFNGENIVYVSYYLLKFIFKPKILLFSKNYSKFS